VTILRSGAGGSDDYLVIDALLSPRYLGQTDPNRDTGNDVGSAAVIFVTNAMPRNSVLRPALAPD
jgi:hypothetical protein